MYTWEIDNYLKERNYSLDDYVKDFHEKIFKTSPQIKHVKFEGIFGAYAKYFLATDDASWTFWVKNKME